MRKYLTFLFFVLFGNFVFADSPLTSTDFGNAYLDIPIVKEAFKSEGKITNEMMDYIDDDANPLDVKLAIINAIGWDHKGLINSKIFFMYVMKKKNYQTDFHNDYIAFKWYATRDELICYSYMLSLDNYFDVVDAFEIAGEALRKSPDSFAVNMIYNLIKCQGLTAFGEYCYASKLFLTLKDNPKLKMDMRKESMSYVFEYMTSVGENCKKE
ncbi:hypothetical protein [Flavobacterium aciduliphilum]|uniref:Tetratricopeptide repeat protein n=1 Tax=Flavobacterium aciduliphilum TaxID=1101402 RepID=A0A328YTE9_9FLAO|nr:hypothetical protein [Flavobacterium aciduliphilum]RAR73827.1 hypothetical protein CLV55_103146 [Flavobacterium aciduliphilum]